MYNEAIKRLASPEIAAMAARPSQVAAAKYSAFSYCVTSRQTLCRQQFDKAFRLDPAFDLQVASTAIRCGARPSRAQKGQQAEIRAPRRTDEKARRGVLFIADRLSCGRRACTRWYGYRFR
ncbi:hypothetical protein LP420_34560 [Massilia sp. B-10]|nr:hypothetical protein LP420_34560 [Massilia sp. B-10]